MLDRFPLSFFSTRTTPSHAAAIVHAERMLDASPRGGRSYASPQAQTRWNAALKIQRAWKRFVFSSAAALNPCPLQSSTPNGRPSQTCSAYNMFLSFCNKQWQIQKQLGEAAQAEECSENCGKERTSSRRRWLSGNKIHILVELIGDFATE